jgi:hypothetical protein
VPFSISPVSGSPYENVFETRSRAKAKSRFLPSSIDRAESK